MGGFLDHDGTFLLVYRRRKACDTLAVLVRLAQAARVRLVQGQQREAWVIPELEYGGL